MSAIAPLANGYPPSAMSVTGLLVMTLVVVASLAAWLGLVFYAARQPRGKRAEHARASLPEGTGTGTAEREEIPAQPAGQVADTGRPAGRQAA